MSIPLRYGTTQTRPTVTIKNEIILCQFLLGTVQHAFQLQVATLKYLSEFVSIPLRYGTTSSRKTLDYCGGILITSVNSS